MDRKVSIPPDAVERITVTTDIPTTQPPTITRSTWTHDGEEWTERAATLAIKTTSGGAWDILHAAAQIKLEREGEYETLELWDASDTQAQLVTAEIPVNHFYNLIVNTGTMCLEMAQERGVKTHATAVIKLRAAIEWIDMYCQMAGENDGKVTAAINDEAWHWVSIGCNAMRVLGGLE